MDKEKTVEHVIDQAQPERIPAHVAIVMDGNGRWAAARGLPRLAGHRAGAENIRRIVEACAHYGIRHLTLYAFSTENWTRPRDEVDGLLHILGEVIDRETPRLKAQGVQVRHLGRLDRLPANLVRAIQHAIETTQGNDRQTLNVCFNYGGRTELLDAVKQIVESGVTPEQINEDLINRTLYSSGTPDPDLIIRTGGEQRLSNFLIWQAAYSEYWFTPCNWPDFDQETLRQALVDYSNRLRKFGMTPEQALATAR
jgi:undecaprenyl diphosphate synthase